MPTSNDSLDNNISLGNIKQVLDLFRNGLMYALDDISIYKTRKELTNAIIHIIPQTTALFREELPFSILEEVVLAPCLKSGNSPLTIASIPCSTGRELYSIAIKFWEVLDLLVLDGYDSNQSFLYSAKKGTYKLDPCDKLFNMNQAAIKSGAKKDDAYTISYKKNKRAPARVQMSEQLINAVNFKKHDILQGGPLPKKYDALFCCNLLYYYSAEGRDIIMNNLANSINDQGFLICESKQTRKGERAEEYLNYLENLTRFGLQKQLTNHINNIDFMQHHIYRKK
ncbi:MAG: CheR family methyltransferase [Candidatus Nanoarchaeia archaeon]